MEICQRILDFKKPKIYIFTMNKNVCVFILDDYFLFFRNLFGKTFLPRLARIFDLMNPP